MSRISDRLVEMKAQSLRRSISASEYTERRVRNNAAVAKEVLTGKRPSQDLPLEIRVLKDKYYSMLKDYTRSVQSMAPLEMNKRSVALWTRVEKARTAAGCSADKFLTAQFLWFDKAFGKAPSVEQLTTEAAIDRALEYTGEAKRVVGNNIKHASDKVSVFRHSEQLVQDIMRAQGVTRVEFYKQFVLTGHFTLPKEFMEADPAYQEVVGD